MHDKGIGLGDLARRLRARGPHDGQPIAAGLAIGLGQRTGRKQHALLLQSDHVLKVARQMLGDLFGCRAALGEDDVELFTQHRLDELADALLRHGYPPLLPGGLCTPSSPRTAASMARQLAAIKDRARGSTHSVPLFSCKQQEKNRRPGTTGACGFPVSSRMTTGNARDRRPSGSARIAVDNRTKQDENRKRAQPELAQRQFARRLGAGAWAAVLFEHERSRLRHPEAMPHVGLRTRISRYQTAYSTARPLIAARTRLHVHVPRAIVSFAHPQRARIW